MLEKLLNAIIALTAALEANAGVKSTAKAAPADDEEETKPLTAAQKKAAAAAKAKADADDEKPARAKKVTREDLTALMNTLKEDLGAPVAKKLIKEVAGVERLAEVDDDDIKALFDAATKKVKAAADAAAEPGEDDGI